MEANAKWQVTIQRTDHVQAAEEEAACLDGSRD